MDKCPLTCWGLLINRPGNCSFDGGIGRFWLDHDRARWCFVTQQYTDMANLVINIRIIQVMGVSMFTDEVVNLMCSLYLWRANTISCGFCCLHKLQNGVSQARE
jgi:hypothetical protein